MLGYRNIFITILATSIEFQTLIMADDINNDHSWATLGYLDSILKNYFFNNIKYDSFKYLLNKIP